MMNTYQQENWLNQPEERKRSYTPNEYGKVPESRPIPLPHEDFDPFYENFTQVDDFLSQTLSSLQDLDIPIGETSQTPYGYDNSQHYSPSTYNAAPQRGHKKTPSGTAIFGFVGHNKTLSIPGIAARRSVTPPDSIAPKLLQPIQPTYTKPSATQNEPILYQHPDELAIGQQQNYYVPQRQQQQQPQSQHSQQLGQSHHQQAPVSVRYTTPVPAPQPEVKSKDSNDFIISNKVPSQYKFPPSPPPSHSNRSERSQQTVQVPVEYLQKLTSMIRKTEGIDMQKFLDYDIDSLVSPAISASTSRASGQTNHQVSTPKNSTGPMITPQSQPQPQRYQALPPPSQHQVQYMPSSSPVGLGIQYDHQQAHNYNHHNHNHNHNHGPVGQDPDDEPESEFVQGPKTPSPTLKSQARFDSSPIKKETAWVCTTFDGSVQTSPKKKQTDNRTSTLPPGEIDQYFHGPREDKTYVCGFEGCGKTFSRRYNVRSHVQTHLSDRPFRCDSEGCNKAFVRQHDLTRHKRIHEEFAYKCPCGKKFSRQDALYKHRTRQICVGGIEEDESSKSKCNSAANGSVKKSPTKKKLPKQTVINFENDKVAKRLDQELMKLHNQKKDPVKSEHPIIKQEIQLSQSTVPDLTSHDDSENVFLNDIGFDQFTSYELK